MSVTDETVPDHRARSGPACPFLLLTATSLTVFPPPANVRPTSAGRWLEPLALALLLAVHAWLAISATTHESTTVDEMAHLMGGHAIWARGDYRLQPENGVMPQLWEGLPAWIQHRNLPPADNPGWSKPNVWTLGNAYFYQLGNDLAALLRNGRAMNVVWSLATGLLVFTWARRLFGPTGAWIGALYWAFCPTFLAHGALATSDMCMTFFMLASVGLYWRHLQHFGWRSGILSAAVFGLAFVAKYSAVLLPIMFLPLATLKLVDPRPLAWDGRPIERTFFRLWALGVSLFVHLAAAIAIIWLFHRFRYLPCTTPELVNDYTKPWAVTLKGVGAPLAWMLGFARHWHLLPDAYLYGFAFVVDMSQMRGAFLNGQTSYSGWVQFFPYAFLVKTPLAVLAASGGSAAAILIRWRRAGLRQAGADMMGVAPLLVLFAMYWAFSLTSKLNIGQRHLLPTYPVVFIGLGGLGWAAARLGRAWYAFAGCLVAAQVVASVEIRPHYLAYFNSLAGGPREGYRHLVDSSLDWGQDLPGLADWITQERLPAPGAPVYLAYFGTGDPEYYGIHATEMVSLLRTFEHEAAYPLHAGVYCISATMLSQAYSAIRDPWSLKLEKEFQDLRTLEPAMIDYTTHPEHRADWEKAVDASRWIGMWKRYEQLRFTRLCYLLRAKDPDAQIGYSINVYRVSAQDVTAVMGDIKTWSAAVEAAELVRTQRR